MKKYQLEIYIPGSKLDTLANFESNDPFIKINKGEILNPAFFPSYENNPNKLLKVTQIEHILWQHDMQEEPTQKVLIFTEEIDNNIESKN